MPALVQLLSTKLLTTNFRFFMDSIVYFFLKAVKPLSRK
jgi:hypothetical protein